MPPNYAAQLARYRKRMAKRASGGLGYGAKVGQTITGALGRGAGGRFVRAADRETIAERNRKLRATLERIKAILRQSKATQRERDREWKRQERERKRREREQAREEAKDRAAQRKSQNRIDLMARMVERGMIAQNQADAFLALIEGGADEAALALLLALGLVDADGNLTRAGRLLKTAADGEKLESARRAMALLTEASKEKAGGQSEYRADIRSCVRALWNGTWNYDIFFDGMQTAIRRGQTKAWYEGAQECGILPAELTKEETVELERAIQYEYQWIDGFATAIEENSQANGGKLEPLFSRAEIWIGRYQGVRAKAMAMACADKKLKWVLGPSEQSCGSCSKLAGKVKRASYWNERGIMPRVHGAPYLECRGFRCQCDLVPTDEPASKGPLPSLP